MPVETRRIGSCPAPATTVMEGYSPRDGLAHGNLDTLLYVCDDHAAVARDEWLPPLTAFTVRGASAEGHQCGEALDFV